MFYIIRMFICGQEFTEDIIQRIQITVNAQPELSRLALSRQVCEWLNWRSPNGKLKDMSCRVALLSLERRGIIQLPEVRIKPVFRLYAKRDLSREAEEPLEVNCNLSDLGKVEIIPVKSRYSRDSQVWRALMQRHHYLGDGPLCGAQMRYLIHNSHYGWLGALAFSAAAWRVKDRDQWIGWDDNIRQQNLDKVVCNSRFLILPHIKAPHLASHVLSLCVRRLVDDWQKRYAVVPVLLETFVQRDRFQGTSYRAANWIHIGSSSGRSRSDHKRQSKVPVKDIYVLALRRDTRRILCEGEVKRIDVCKKACKAPADWAEEEFGEAEIGDERLKKRLLTLTRDMYAKPEASIPQACGGRAKTKAAYRFFDNKEVTMDKLMKPHYESTTRRIKQHKVVLAVQDTTSLNYSAHPATEGLGLIGTKADGSIGLIVHDTMAFSVDGTPIGLLDVQSWVREPEDFGKRHRRHELPIEQKESNKWLKSMDAVAEAQKQCRETVIVSVADREADIYELFEKALRDKEGPKLLVRAERERLLADGHGHLWEKLSLEDVQGIQEIRVPRRSNRPARDAQLEVRFLEVKLKPPKKKPHLPEIKVWAILAEEVEQTEDISPLKWMLLSTIEVSTFEQATEKLTWYAGRWGIEVYHRTLKSGCKIEERQLGSADRIEACLAIDMVVAWRIYHLTKLGRETPDVPCTVFFEESEWKALVAYKTQNPAPPEKPPTLREAVRMIASLGGFLGRKGDGEPGTKTLWLGLQRLDDIADTWKIMVTAIPQLLIPAVSRSPGYG